MHTCPEATTSNSSFAEASSASRRSMQWKRNGRVRKSDSFCDSRTGAMGGLRPPGAGAPDPTRAHRHGPLTTSEPRGRPSAEFGSHAAYGFPRKHEFPNTLVQDRTFYKFII